MAKLDQQIEALEKRLKQVKERRRMIEGRKRAAESAKSADDTRRKILIGLAVLAQVKRGEWPEDQLQAMMASSLIRTDDRALFGLDPLPSQE
jgi:hypothetical protein